MVFAVNILQFIFLSLKLDDIVSWSWVVSKSDVLDKLLTTFKLPVLWPNGS